jgi:hypothetical protein
MKLKKNKFYKSFQTKQIVIKKIKTKSEEK